jgi:hypothetical protein
MDMDYLVTRMGHNAEAIRSLAQGVSEEQARWKPDPDSWSILEVINHLYDEEREDFRAHLDAILHHPERPWAPIAPQRWVVERHYNQRDLAQSVTSFVQERERSIAWLRGLTPDWQAAIEAPFGRLTAGDVFASWVAHDLLHVRQLVRLHWAYTLHLVEPYRVEYAGSW